MTATVQLKVPCTVPDWSSLAETIATEIAAFAEGHDDEASFVSESYAKLRDAEFFKAMVPVEFGGHGADYREMCGVIRRLGAICGSTALAFAMHQHQVATAVWRWRNQQAPVEGLLKRVANEGLILVSSGGSDWLESAGTATQVEGGFRINARKGFASGCVVGDLLMTSVVFDDPANGPTVLHFGVSLKAEGVSIEQTWNTMGMRGTGSHDVVLDNVFIPEASVSGRRPQGKWHPLFHAISMVAFPMIYSAYVGVADGARASALSLVGGRRESADLPYLVGEMDNALMAATLALDDMIANAETSMPGPVTTSRAMTGRTLAGDAAIRTVEKALEVAGGRSFYRKAGLERAFRDVQGARFHPMQEKAQLRFSGRVALGLDIDG